MIGFAPWYEGVGIAIAVALATLVATWSEYSNENEFQKLLEEASLVKVKTFRDNTLQEISINDLVAGDHVVLQPGDTVPADGYLLAGKLEVNAAALTGESEPIKKVPAEDPNKIDEERNELPRAARAARRGMPREARSFLARREARRAEADDVQHLHRHLDRRVTPDHVRAAIKCPHPADSGQSQWF